MTELEAQYKQGYTDAIVAVVGFLDTLIGAAEKRNTKLIPLEFVEDLKGSIKRIIPSETMKVESH